jgi:DNA-directed RNA polymerase subunit RPC12/RpoP
MGKAPAKCPACGSIAGWKHVGEEKKGFSVGKAAAGAVLLGPIGLVGGALGKKKESYYCTECGFRNDY